ncbi:MAG TPA: 30S ribosomal protein S12 methylthiotransferase RimO [Aggregatilineales bacterium]|nr:30S ribosomal protein S12 methylthiotransferase RimO [Aggregatilineales bacterium]
MAKRHNKYFLLSLGCSKNTVDSESMAQLLNGAGMSGVGDSAQAEVLIVNTCGFINAAKEESLNALRDLAAGKKRDQLLIAAGCMAQRYGAELVAKVPGLDGVIGTRRWMDIVDLIGRLRARKHPEPLYHLPTEALTVGQDEKGAQRISIQGASAYVKIADGCRRPCAFCAIPLIKGTAVSRPVESILAEARTLEARGIQEMILIAQDTTDYGHDLGMKDGLAHLLERLTDEVPGVPWIRVMYAYPGYVTDHLIETMASRPQILHYLDMPLQHGSRSTLLRMRRPANIEWCYNTIQKMRTAMPDLAIRTTFIVGYPGETDQEFEELLTFVRDLQFDRVGVFTYSYEENTPSAEQASHVPEEVKQARRDALMEVQQTISLARNHALVGKTLDVLIEGQGDGLTIARSYRDAPEIDGYVILEGEAPAGRIVPARITGAMNYDLVATVDVKMPLIMP